MADVDLIPADYANARRVWRRVRQLLFACIAIAVTVGGARLVLQLGMSQEKQRIDRLDKEGLVTTRIKVEADAFRQQKLFAEKQLADLDELRGGDRLRLLLQAIDAAWSDSIWLDELRFLRTEQAATGNMSALPGGAQSNIVVVPRQNVPVPGAAATPAGIEQRVEIIGHATNHTRLAEFMRSLGSQPGIAQVSLRDTGLGAFGNAPMVNLTLVVLVDDKLGKPR